jgi:hypothetical protein
LHERILRFINLVFRRRTEAWISPNYSNSAQRRAPD